MQPPDLSTGNYGTFVRMDVEPPVRRSLSIGARLNRWIQGLLEQIPPVQNRPLPQPIPQPEELAAKLFDEALFIEKNYPSLLNLAVKKLEDANEFDPGKPHILTKLADLSLKQGGSPKRSLKFYNEALQYDPSFAPALMGREKARVSMRKFHSY